MEHKLNIWFSDRLVKDQTGFIRICRKIKFDKSLIKKLILSPEDLENLETARKKPVSDQDMIKLLVEGI